MFTRRGILSAGISSALTVMGCGFGRHPAPPFRFVVTPWVGNAPFYVAKERRFFGDIDLRIASFGTDFDVWRALVDHRADFTTGTMFDILRGSGIGVNLQIISVTDFSNGADGIVGAGVEQLANLAGKRVGVSLGTLTHFLLARALERVGVAEETLRLEDMSMDEALAAINAGKIDAAPFWEPFLGKALAAPGRKLLFTSREIPGEIVDVVAANTHALDSRPGFLTTLLDGWERGLRLLQDAPEEAVPLAVKYLEMKPEELREALSGIQLVSRAGSRDMFERGATPSVFTAYENALRFGKKHGFLKRDPKPPELLFAAAVRDREPPR